MDALTTLPHDPTDPTPGVRPARPPESPRRRRLIRASAVVGLVVGVVYLGWRLTTLNPDALGLSVLLWLLEAHAVAGLGLFTFSLWDVDGAPTPAEALPDLQVAVLIPTYDEPTEVLLPTIAAAVALEPAHETWVLDDGDRPEVARLARELGARYLTRPEHVDAKAGNLNHALGVVEADVVAVLDADHVASPGLLRRTLPYFHDPDVALVQTPQDFYNEGSFEHVHAGQSARRRLVYSEQALFYREIQPGKNRWNGAFWCGTGAVLRTAALGSVGLVATGSITEDIQTTIRLHRAGWRTVYHDEVLARGLAAQTAEQYALQRRRWCTGAMQVLRQERPLTGRGLTLPQRLTYCATLLGWFDALRLLGFLLLPPVVLVTGQSPIAAHLPTFLLLFVAAWVLQHHALVRLSRGRMRPIPAAVFDLVRLGPTLAAIVTGLTGRRVGFRVTPKGRTGEGHRARLPRLLVVLLAFHVAALLWYASAIADVVDTTYAVPGVAHGAAFWALVNGSLLVLALARIAADRFAAERRASHRHPISAFADLDGRASVTTDLSLTGARVLVPADQAPSIGDEVVLRIHLDVVTAPFAAVVRSVRPVLPDEAGRARRLLTPGPSAEVAWVALGVEFVAADHGARAQLALGLFQARVRAADPPAETVAPIPA